MSILSLISTANKNLLLNKFRTFLTIAALFVASLCIFATNALGDGIRQFATESTASYVSDNYMIVRGGSDSLSPNQIPISSEATEYKENRGRRELTNTDVSYFENEFKDLKKIIKNYGVTYEYITSDSANGKKFTGSGTTLIDGVNYRLEAGNLPKNSGEIVISSKYVSVLGYDNPQKALGKELSISVKDYKNEIFTRPFNVVGVLENNFINSDGDLIIESDVSDLSLAQNPQIEDVPEKYNSLILVFKDKLSTERIKQIQDKLNEKDIAGVTASDQISTVINTFNSLQTALLIFAGIALLASLLGVTNTILMGVLERVKDIGLMRALGMSRLGIFGIYTFEALSLGFWGCLIGILPLIFATPLINQLASNTFLKSFIGYDLLVIKPESVLVTVIIILSAVFIVSIIPSIQASRKDPITALKYE
jgi:putative ABC transport system permease protein